MKITIKKDSSVEETEITVTCRTMSPELEEIVAYIGLFDNTITGMKNGETFFSSNRGVYQSKRFGFSSMHSCGYAAVPNRNVAS